MTVRNFSRGDFLMLLVLSISTAAVYARTARFDFVNVDDPEYVTQNSHVRSGLSAANLRWAITTFTLANWHPLTWLSYMLDVELFGMHAGAFHLENAAWHVANALLLFLFLRAATGSRWRSALVAALFALHPLHVESVAWIAERKDVLSTFFGFVALIAYLRYTHRRSGYAYAALTVALSLSLLAKPTLVTLPFVLLLLDYWPLRRSDKIRWSALVLEKIPLVALSVGSSVMTLIAQRAGGAMNELRDVPLSARIENAAASYLHYILDTAWPQGLAVLYPLPRAQPLALTLVAVAFLVLITICVQRLAARARYLPVGWYWYLGTLVPTIGIVSVGEQARADRYTYVPLIGLFIMLAWSIPVPRTNRIRVGFTAAAALLLVVLSIQTWRQLGVWRNGETLLSHALATVEPTATLHANYGVTLALRGDYAAAAKCYQAALRLRPLHLQSMNNLGDCMARLGRVDEAIGYFRRVLELNPDYAAAHLNLGMRLAQRGQLAEAKRELAEAVRLQPIYSEVAARTLDKARQPPATTPGE